MIISGHDAPLASPRQSIQSGRTADGITVRQMRGSLALVATREVAVWACGRRAIGRAVRMIRAARK